MAYRVAFCYVCRKPILKGPIPFDDEGEYHQACYDRYLEFLEPGRTLKEIGEYLEKKGVTNEVLHKTHTERMFSMDGWD